MEKSDGVGTAANAGYHVVGIPPLRLMDLALCLFTYNLLELANHHRIGMRPHHRADNVEGVIDIRHPVTDRFIGSILQGSGATLHRSHLGTQKSHPLHVELLTLHILGAHIDHPFHAETCTRSGCSHTMLSRSGFGDDTRFSHPLCEQDLRSEEHTSELQSRGHLVCRLLLEKKKQRQ